MGHKYLEELMKSVKYSGKAGQRLFTKVF